MMATLNPEFLRNDARVVAEAAGLASEVSGWTEDTISTIAGDPGGARDVLLRVADTALNPVSAWAGHTVVRQLDVALDAFAWTGEQGSRFVSGEAVDPDKLGTEFDARVSRVVDSLFWFKPIATTREVSNTLDRVEAAPAAATRSVNEVWTRLKVRMGLACENDVFSSNPCW